MRRSISPACTWSNIAMQLANRKIITGKRCAATPVTSAPTTRSACCSCAAANSPKPNPSSAPPSRPKPGTIPIPETANRTITSGCASVFWAGQTKRPLLFARPPGMPPGRIVPSSNSPNSPLRGSESRLQPVRTPSGQRRSAQLCWRLWNMSNALSHATPTIKRQRI